MRHLKKINIIIRSAGYWFIFLFALLVVFLPEISKAAPKESSSANEFLKPLLQSGALVSSDYTSFAQTVSSLHSTSGKRQARKIRTRMRSAERFYLAAPECHLSYWAIIDSGDKASSTTPSSGCLSLQNSYLFRLTPF